LEVLSGKHNWRLLASAAASAGALACSTAVFAQAEEDAAAQVDDAVAANKVEYITVTGFRSAVQQALEQERIAINARESIFAGDLAKTPDLNLAQAMQRVPGLAISRAGGEGRQITFRGLGPQFTRTTFLPKSMVLNYSPANRKEEITPFRRKKRQEVEKRMLFLSHIAIGRYGKPEQESRL
jgi:outer membrane receptor for Fe3+-dicitrate